MCLFREGFEICGVPAVADKKQLMTGVEERLNARHGSPVEMVDRFGDARPVGLQKIVQDEDAAGRQEILRGEKIVERVFRRVTAIDGK